jgi:hypothetical protein
MRDKTRVEAQFQDNALELDVAGSVFSVAAIAEQVGWMGAALRSSTNSKEAAYSTPHLAELNVASSSSDSSSTTPHGVATLIGSCEIRFKMEILQDTDLSALGSCWRGLFGNPVIVRGFPIPRRSESDRDTGLEIPLDMVVALTSCQRVAKFAGMTYLKGFAAMLAAMRVVGDVVFWHLCYNPDGNYISYEDGRAARPHDLQSLSMAALEGSRHIVGWSDNVVNFFGACDANYDIEWTELPEPGSTHVLEKVTLSGSAGPFITAGASFLVGVKDKPLHLGFTKDNDYMGHLLAIGKRSFVFYDSEERRAWLVDGVSAVLHILRAYLKFYTEDSRVGEYFMYSEGDIEEPPPGVAHTGAKAAYAVLANPKNQNLPLYPKRCFLSEEKVTKLGAKIDVDDVTTIRTTCSSFTLADRVEQICHVLLQATAYHDDISTQSGFGWRIKASPRHQIEGFEYVLLCYSLILHEMANVSLTPGLWTSPPDKTVCNQK